MSDNTLELRCIADLLKEEFFIPDYQRGYRWSPSQVEALLSDIWKFRQDNHEARKEVFYCLQPIVVAPGEEGWVVIDGQQRLTTINLILTFLDANLGKRKRRNFGLSYQTRPDSEQYLKSIEAHMANENPDYYHIFKAYRTIEKWFEDKGGNSEINFVQTLLNSDEEGKNVKVIWYQVSADGTNHIDIFTRLNIGKIPLTNSELIKALLLQKSNFTEDTAYLKQIQIATEWDNIERTLHQPEFWFFIYNTDNVFYYENHFEYIFDLMYERKVGHERYYTFNKFAEKALDSKNKSGRTDINNLWQKVKSYFLTFEEWYIDRELYHLIGFLVSCGESITELKKANHHKRKNEFKQFLYDRIGEHVAYDIQTLEYGYSSDREKIRKVLLLFNIQTLIANKGADVRFPFHQYKEEHWDIEHIRSQSDKLIKGPKQQKAWANDIIEYVTGFSINELAKDAEEQLFDWSSLDGKLQGYCSQLMEFHQDPDNEIFQDLRHAIEIYFEDRETDGESESDSIDTIGNLALLDENTNRSYKNALFPIKRKKIIENDSTGRFVPICTKNVFLKYYSRQSNNMMYWNESDAKAYQQAIIETLKPFFPNKN